MTGEYAVYINLLKTFTACFNLLVFLFLFKTKMNILLVLYFILFLVLIIGDVSVINFVIFVLALSAYGDGNKNIKTYAYSKLIIVLIIIISSFLFELNSNNIIYDYVRGTRFTLGFTNPNTASMMVFDILIALAYLYNKNKKVITISLLLIICVNYFTDSRTVLFAYLFFLFLLFLNDKVLSFLKPIVTRMFLVFFVFSLLIAFLHETILNSFLNNRPHMYYEFLVNHSVNLFGYSKGLTRDGLIISADNSYLRILIQLGIIYFLIHSILMKKIIGKLFIGKDYLGVKIILSILFYDIFEQFTIAQGSVLLVFIANYLISEKMVKTKLRH
ncbi:hypothetical protein [Paenibacillus sp. NRS-1760]|uniref:hypothetical protein n=1 Tax=Paenibacillus sp. NRS-1760 TaxID=3233902 RepID=UPI003D2C6E61